MKKRTVSIFLAFSMSFALCTSFSYAEEKQGLAAIELHVAPDGSDTANGKITSPLATLKGAKAKVRTMRKVYGKKVPINVYFHEGRYPLTSTVEFDASDTGYADAPTTYAAYGGDYVEFSGSVPIDISHLTKVTDRKILERFPDTSRDKIGYLSLADEGIKKEQLPAIPSYCTAGDMKANAKYFNDISFILDGEEQPISQWPNGRYNYTTFEGVTQGSNTENSGGTFSYTDINPINWLEAKDMYIEGWFTFDYFCDRVRVSSIDSANRQITLKYGAISSTQSRRWKAMNLLEEIDVPGEWYVDRDKMILYYYPRYNLSNSKMEMTVMSDNMINLKGTSSGPSHIVFDGLNFRNSRGGAISGASHSDNVTVRNCSFKGIDGYNISTSGAMGQSLRWSDNNEWETFGSYTKDGCKNWLIENNAFYQNGTCSIQLSGGGDANKREFSGHVIRNNYITLGQLENPGAHTIENLSAIGVTIENNLIHNLAHHAIDDNGQSNSIKYNEINNVVKATQDSGAIYSGRSLLRRGSEIAFNYIKDTKHQIKGVEQHNRAIYFDDELCQQYVHHNFCIDGDKAITFGGSSGMIYNNIASDMLSGYHIKPYGAMWETNQKAKYDKWINGISRGTDPAVWNLWNTTFPQLQKEYDSYMSTGNVEMLFDTITDNIAVNSGMDMSTDEFFISRGGKAWGNESYDNYEMFVNPSEDDYRIKKDSEVLKNHPGLLSEEFDLSSIGIKWDEFGGKDRASGNHAFKMIYPQNNAGSIQRTDVNFVWQQSVGADVYHFALSDDPEFKTVLVEEDVYDNTFVVPELSANDKTYYWKVTASNTTRSLADTWEPEEKVFSFSTAKFDNVNFDSLTVTKGEVERRKARITEGDEPGLYRVGTLDNINTAIAAADDIMKKPKGAVTQKEVNAVESKLSDSIQSSVWQIPGFVDAGKLFGNRENWNAYYDNALVINGDQVDVCTTDSAYDKLANVSLTAISEMSKSVLFGFKMKCDWYGEEGGNWMGIGIRGNKDQIIYSQYNYFVVMKRDILEYQIRSSGLTGIIEEKDNTFIKDDEWVDVVFGAYDCGYGQLSILMINGELVFSYLDDTLNQLRNEGCFTMFAGTNSKLSVKPYDKEFDIDFDKLVVDAGLNAAVKRGNELRDAVGDENTVTLAVGASKYYHDGQIKTSSVAPQMSGDEISIPAEVLKECFGIDAGSGLVSAADITSKYGKSVYNIDNTIILSSESEFYMYNGIIPYTMSIIAKELLKISE